MKRYIKPVLFLNGLLFSMFLFSSCQAQPSAGRKYNVGFTIINLASATDPSGTISVAVWYPTGTPERKYQYGGPAWGNIAPESAPLADAGKFPFLAFSHGYGGCGLGSAFFTEALASQGWIVACPDHHDSYSFFRLRTGRVKNISRKGALKDLKELVSSSPEDKNKYLFRPMELEEVIEGMISSERFGRLIDTGRIAAGGHSFGGFTSMGLCGTIPSLYDHRIKALLLFSTGAAAYLFTAGEMQKVSIPSMLLMGSREENQYRGNRTMGELSESIYANMPQPKYFLEVKGGNHFSFNNRLSYGFGTRALSGNEREFEVITRYSLAFLKKYVAGINDREGVLSKKDKMISHMESSVVE